LGRGKRTADIESAQVWLDDIDAVVTAAARLGAPVFLIGTSWGARLALAYAQTQGNGKRLQAVALVVPAFWTNADSLFGLWFAPVLRWFGLSISLEKRLPPEVYLPKGGRAGVTKESAEFLAEISRDDPRLVKRVTFRALDEARKLSKMALRNPPALPVTSFFDEADALVKQPRSRQGLGDVGIVPNKSTHAGHGVQVLAPEELANVLLPWLEEQLLAH
jgi:pimeloyl-ACP methyl ester carboxylesterase